MEDLVRRANFCTLRSLSSNMKRLLYLAIPLAFAACFKQTDSDLPQSNTYINEFVNLTIVNQNPDAVDSVRGHVADTFTWSLSNAYGDTSVVSNGHYQLPLNAPTFMLEGLISGYGTGAQTIGESWLTLKNGSDFSTIGLRVSFPDDTANLSLGYPLAGQTGGGVTFADTVAVTPPMLGFGLQRMLAWWRNDAIPMNDTITKDNVNLNTNPLMLNIYDTLTIISKSYIGDELVVSGTFSERMYTALAFTYEGSFCRKSWYVKGGFSNLIYVFYPD